MTITTFTNDCLKLIFKYGPTVVYKVINFARNNWRRVLDLVRRYGGVSPAFPYLRRAAGA